MSKQLPVIRLADKSWYIDVRLKEVRNIHNPHDRFTLDEFMILKKIENQTSN